MAAAVARTLAAGSFGAAENAARGRSARGRAAAPSDRGVCTPGDRTMAAALSRTGTAGSCGAAENAAPGRSAQGRAAADRARTDAAQQAARGPAETRLSHRLLHPAGLPARL